MSKSEREQEVFYIGANATRSVGMSKYEITNETVNHAGIILHRIRALKRFGFIDEGQLGGFIESDKNLSQEGNSWVGGDAYVYGGARVYGDAHITGSARIFGDAEIFENAWISGTACVFDSAMVHGNSSVYSNAQVYGNTDIFGSSQVQKDAQVYGDAVINECAIVCGDFLIKGGLLFKSKDGFK